MKIAPPTKRRERILGMGKSGVGKTHAWMELANYVEGNFWIIDTDDAVSAMSEDDTLSAIEDKLAEEPVMPMNWSDFRDTAERWKKKAAPEDWAIVDMNNEAWNTVQAHYTEQVFGMDEDEYLLKQRKEIEQLEEKGSLYSNTFGGWMDWPVINKMYRRYALALLRLPCHLFIITPVDKVDPKTDGKEILERYGQAGVKPIGQKHQDHMASSILYFHGRAPDKLHLTTVKDRGKREYVSGKQLERGFARDYLVDVAGWQIKKKKKTAQQTKEQEDG